MHKPEQTISYQVYKEGAPNIGLATVESPQIQYMVETLSGSGITGEYEAPVLGMTGPLSLKLTFTNRGPDYYRLQDTLTDNELHLYASIQLVDETTGLRKHVQVRIAVSYAVKTASGGKFESAKKGDSEVELVLTRYREFYDGVERVFIDKLNFMHRINGVDILMGVRADLGMDY